MSTGSFLMSHRAVQSLGTAVTSPNKLVKCRSKHSSIYLLGANRPLVTLHNYSASQTQSPFIQAFAQSLDATITYLLTHSLTHFSKLLLLLLSPPFPPTAPSFPLKLLQFSVVCFLISFAAPPFSCVATFIYLHLCFFLSTPAGTLLKIPVLICRCNSFSVSLNVAFTDFLLEMQQ